MQTPKLLSKEKIRLTLIRLGELAFSEGEFIDLVIVGGAGMVLLFNCRDSTEDIDAITLNDNSKNLVRRLALQIESEFELPNGWLNDGAKGFLNGYEEGPVVLESKGIKVVSPVYQQLLAMKLGAWRDDIDIQDAILLLRNIPGTKIDIWDTVQPFIVPGRELKAQYAFEDIWNLK